MSSTLTPEQESHGGTDDLQPFPTEIPREHYLNVEYGWKSWLFTLDHKRIAILYLISITFMFFIGGLAATLVRLNLLTPHSELLRPQTYNKMFSMHGIVMVFFFLIPAIPAILGNFLVPMMLGAKDLAFPKLNLLSWYLYMAGALVGIGAMVYGGVDTGWTFYAPLSTQYAYGNVALTIVGAFLAGFSSILTGLNFIVTTHKMRAPGLTWFRLPLFIWSIYATSLIQILATPVLAITLLLLAVERIFQVGVFDPKMGGDPVLMQHFFWFYSHPAVYIMVLPGMAVVSEIIANGARRPVFGYKMVAFASLAIAVISFLVWGHHMFTTTQSPYAGMIFSFLSFLVAIPSAIKVFNWTATLYKGSIRLHTPMLYVLGFIGLFTIGGLTGMHLASIAVDLHMHDTYFIVAHFHYIMVGGTVMAYLGGIHFWWPKMTGRLYNEVLGKTSAIIIFLGFNLTFFPQFIVGYQGMPRRYATYAPEFQVLNVLSSAGASILAVGFMLPFFYLLWSLKNGKIAGPNPFNATGLEWQTPSPPPTLNFDRTPVVTIGPYAYNPEADELADALEDVERAREDYEQTRTVIAVTNVQDALAREREEIRERREDARERAQEERDRDA
ncbi:MAG: cytochrome c oxidase subunit I [Armatimonadetes bacterium]|nr:cytochrome c oxidase subunit I [Armatimonadota bacterium]